MADLLYWGTIFKGYELHPIRFKQLSCSFKELQLEALTVQIMGLPCGVIVIEI